MRKFTLRRAVCVLSVCTLCISAMTYPTLTASAQSKEEEIQDKIDDKEAQKAQSQKNESSFQKELDALQDDLDVINGKVNSLNTQIAQKNAVIKQYQDEMNSLQSEIDQATQKQADLEQQISGTYEQLSERLCAAYMAGETSTLELLLTAEDFETFLTRLELVKRISEHDTALVADLQQDITDLNDTKEKLSRDKAEVEEKKAAVQSERDAVEADRAEVLKAKNLQESKQNSIEQKLSQQQKTTNQLNADIQFLNEEMERYIAEKAQGMGHGSGTLSGGGNSGNYKVSSKGMICPLQYPNVQYKTYSNHRATDLTTSGATGNTYGKEIRAAADGVVYSAEYHYSWGNNVYINHGNGVYTRYAHCSKMLVSPGQHVKQGDVIALVGNTGNVSPRPSASNPHAGAHLHFEVYVNGNRVNDPRTWLP